MSLREVMAALAEPAAPEVPVAARAEAQARQEQALSVIMDNQRQREAPAEFMWQHTEAPAEQALRESMPLVQQAVPLLTITEAAGAEERKRELAAPAKSAI